MPKTNLDMLSNKQRSNITTDWKKFSPRFEVQKLPQCPDLLDYSQLFPHQNERQQSLNVGAMNFNLRPNRPPFIKDDPLKRIEHDS